MKFTKKQIDKERKQVNHKITIVDKLCMEGSVNGLETRIKDQVKRSWKWTNQRWGNGDKFRLSEISIEEEEECPDMYRDAQYAVFYAVLNKKWGESDEDVIKRLTKNANAKASAKVRKDNAKEIQKKRTNYAKNNAGDKKDIKVSWSYLDI